MSTQHLILGPPGTGKTTRLLRVLDAEIKAGVRPDRIAFLSFTKRATEEARHRAMVQFRFKEDDLPWFRTLHSLAYNRLGLRRDEVMGPKQYRELGAALGLTFQGKSDLEEGVPTAKFTGDRYTFIDGYARARRIRPEDAWRAIAGDDDELNWWEFRRFRATLDEYKRERGLVDFSDMLELEQAPLDVDVVIIDEAQDLSSLQWMYVDRVLRPLAKRIYVAGDDDQAIFQWSGADVPQFQALSGEREVLSQSYRVPGAVHAVAERIVGGIARRFPKRYLPRKEQGSVQYHFDPDGVDLDAPGSWLLLARNAHLLLPLVAMVRSQGHNYLFRGEPAANPQHIRSILCWERQRRGEPLAVEDVELVASFLDPRIRRRNLWPDRIWHEVMTRMPLADREWYISVLRRGEKLTGKPRINISTIHSTKGGEADNVLLLTDVSARTWQGMQVDGDSERRVWYVGATRAKEALHIAQPTTRMGVDL